MAKKVIKEKQKIERAPIVAILGHVDHGKTTILDKIREANVQECEVGGITQKISVFTVDPDCTGTQHITFIDTPGHEAFDLMRMRGGSIADIALLVIAADDGVKPQTEESIEIIKNSGAHPIVVVNKMDLPNADIEKVKREISTHGLIPEDMGGKVPVVGVSGKTGKGIKDLLDMINLVVDVEGIEKKFELTDRVLGRAFILESVKDQSQGFVSSIVVVQGEFKKGDYIVYSKDGDTKVDRAKGFVSEENVSIAKLENGYGGKLIGLSSLLDLGSSIISVDEKDRKKADKIYKLIEKCDENPDEECSEEVAEAEETEEDFWGEFFAESEEEDVKNLNVIIKSSSEGSLQAILKSTEGLGSEKVKLTVLDSGVGDISQSDVEKAEISRAIILGFEVSKEAGVDAHAKSKRVLIREYDIIYKMIDELKETLDMLEEGGEEEEEIGEAEVREIFILSDGSKVIGGRVKKGVIKRDRKCYVVRGDDIIAEGKIISLKHLKEEITQANTAADFGLILDPSPEDVEKGDRLFCVEIVKR